MKKFLDYVVDSNGDPVVNATATVYFAGTLILATIFDDNGVTSVLNPRTSEADGSFYFYVANGRYDIVIAATGLTFDDDDTKDISIFESILVNVIKASDFTNLDDAITSIGATAQTLLIEETEVADVNTTVPENINLWFAGKGEISVNTGITVTINGPQPDAPLRKIFTGAGTVVFGSSYYGEVEPSWHGVVADDATDNLTDYQAAIDGTPVGVIMRMPSGIARINGELIRNQATAGIPNRIHIKGRSHSVLKQMSLTANTLTLSAVNSLSGWALEDFVVAQIAGATSGTAINLIKCHRGYAKNVIVSGSGGRAWHIQNGIINDFYHCGYHAGLDLGFATAVPTHGVVFDDDGIPTSSNSNTWWGGMAEGVTTAPGIGLLLTGTASRGIKVYGMALQVSTIGVQVDAGVTEYELYPWLESNTTQFILTSNHGIFRPTGDLPVQHSHISRVRARLNNNVTVTTGTPTAIGFDKGDDYDVGQGMHNIITLNERIVAELDGLHRIWGIIEWAAGTTGYRRVDIRLNGTTIIGSTSGPPAATIGTFQPIETEFLMLIDDFVELVVTHTEGANLDVVADGITQFGMRWVAENV